jgi:sterol 3beta-glucosyltransferase
MSIVIPAIGTRGDVQPFIALAQGLERAGHRVTLLSHPVMRPLVEDHGISFAPMGPDVDIGQVAADIRLKSHNTIVGLVRVMQFAFDMLEASHEDILAHCRMADLVVTSAQSAAGKNEADLLGLPNVSVSFMPWALPVEDPERPRYKRVAYSLLGRAIGLITTRPLNRMRRRQGLPPVGAEGFTSTRLNLVPVSPAVYPPEPLWASRHQMVGYWFVDEPDGWKPPTGLDAFLESGKPLVVSLGAMSLGHGDALETAGLFVEAIERAGVRAIVQGWGQALAQMSLPQSIYAAGSLPHGWLLARCAGLVHHGGFGTTSAGFRAGIPQLVIPHIADQFFWGQRVGELGAGLPPIRRSALDASGLAAALELLAEDGALRLAAARIADRLQAEEGVARAVHLIEATLDPVA